MQKFTRKEAQKYIKRRLRELSKQGYDLERLTKGKTVEQLAWSSKSLEQFKKTVTRVKERVREEKKKLEAPKRAKRNLISDKTVAIVKNNLEIKPTKANIRKVTMLEADKFFNTYFKSVLGDVNIEKKINQLKRRFGNRLDLLHDFIDKVTQIDFNYEIDGVIFSREQFESDFSDNWNDLMEERLDKMFSILNKKDFMI